MKSSFTRRKLIAHMALGGVASLPLSGHAEEQAGSPNPGSVEKPKTTRRRPRIVAFDVIETLFDTKPLDKILAELGLPEGSLQIWFPRFLRDAMALEVVGRFLPFSEVASASLEALLKENHLEANRNDIQKVLHAFGTLPVHSDVMPAFNAFSEAGVKIITLTNGSADTTRKMLVHAGLDEFVQQVISIDEPKHWKPARDVYLHAVKTMKTEPHFMALVAAHDWDIAGAGSAGLTTGGVARNSKQFSTAMPPPDVMGTTLLEVAEGLLAFPE